MTAKLSAQCLTCGSNGSGMSLMISVEEEQQYSSDIRILDRILVNVGDGCQKYCNERGIKLSSISAICITSFAPHNISGLPGILLSLSSLGVGAINIIGPPGLEGVLINMDHFVRRTFPYTNVIIVKDDDYITSNNLIRIYGRNVDVKTKNDHGKTVAVSYEFDLDISSHKYKKVIKDLLRVIVHPVANSFNTSPSLNQLIESNIIKTNEDTSLSLFVYFPIQIGSLNHEVINNIKRIHTKNQLMGVCYQGYINDEVSEYHQAILSLQSLSNLVPPLFNTPIFDPSVGENIKLWCDICGSDDIEEQKYLNSGSLYPAVYALSFSAHISSEKENHNKRKHIKVHFKWNFNSIANNKDEESKENVQEIIESKISPPHPSDITVTMLGTGCAVPSKYRSNSAILVGIPNTNTTDTIGDNVIDKESNKTYSLLDCGSCCASQIVLNYGHNRIKLLHVLKNIRFVWISHHHADHQSGLSMLLELIWAAHHNTLYESSLHVAADETKKPKICVLANSNIIRYQEYMACICGLDSYVDFLCVPNINWRQLNSGPSNSLFPQPKRHKSNTDSELQNQSLEISQKVAQLTLGAIKELQYVPVEHCANSFAIILQIQLASQIFKLVYSGDCLPSLQLQRAGQGCDLLIHEATFDETKELDAKEKRHCTTAQAKLVAMHMQAKHTILTHFSQRYPWSSISDENNDTPKKCVTINSNSDITDKNEIYIDDSNESDDDDDNNESVSYALDFISMSFPSQASELTEATLFIGKEMSRRDRIKKEERRKKTELQ